jgi:predicted alpha/beta hydrolase
MPSSFPETSPARAQAEHLTIRAADGYPLAARLWTAPGVADPATVAMINAGAGINSLFYDRFAAFLAESGYPALVYDYRGIGQSRHGSLRGFQATVDEWGSKDCAAVLDWLSARYPFARRLVVGHSVGGFLTGFAQNGHLIDRMLLVGAHTGYWRDYAPRAQLGMFLLWHTLMPLLARAVGYFPGRQLRLLEDLPAGVALQWAARRRPDFWWNLTLPDGSPDAETIAELVGRFRAIRAPALALRFSDDPFATVAATDRIVGLYASCSARRMEIVPADVDGRKIGHFGFFRSRCRATLWPRVVSWLAACDAEARCPP